MDNTLVDIYDAVNELVLLIKLAHEAGLTFFEEANISYYLEREGSLLVIERTPPRERISLDVSKNFRELAENLDIVWKVAIKSVEFLQRHLAKYQMCKEILSPFILEEKIQCTSR